MKRLLHIATALFLALATLVGSTGLSLHKMACLDSGRISFSLEQDFCCASENTHTDSQAIVPICCAFDQLAFGVSDFDFQKLAAKFLVQKPELQSAVLLFVGECLTTFLFEQFVPPLSVGARLSLFCTYLI